MGLSPVVIRSGLDAYSTRKEWRNPIGAYGAWDKKGYYELQTPNGYSINTDFMLMADHKFGNFSLDGFVGGNIYFYQDNKHTSHTKNGLLVPGFYSLKSSVDPAATSSSVVKKPEVWFCLNLFQCLHVLISGK